MPKSTCCIRPTAAAVIQLVVFVLSICLAACDPEEDVSYGGGESVRKHSREDALPSERLRKEQQGSDEYSPHLDHQAILGSESLAHEYDELPPEKAKEKLRILASKMMDKDSDGFVSHSELTDFVHNALMSLDQEETDERFDEMDTDKDDSIAWGEYIQEAFGVEPGLEAEQFKDSPEDMKLMNEDERYFKAADLDLNKILSRKEFEAFQNPEHFSHMHQVLVENTMLEKDIDKDGRISLKEYLGETYDQPTSEWYVTEKNRFDEEYDRDHDGYLTGDEIKAWLIPDIGITAKQEADHLIKVADVDQVWMLDGKLSIEEIVAAHKAFVGSEATGYGEKLNDLRHEEL